MFVICFFKLPVRVGLERVRSTQKITHHNSVRDVRVGRVGLVPVDGVHPAEHGESHGSQLRRRNQGNDQIHPKRHSEREKTFAVRQRAKRLCGQRVRAADRGGEEVQMGMCS